MSDIKPRVSGTGHVPVSSTRFNTCANFSNNCNGSACNSSTLHPSAPGALVLFIFLQAILSFPPSSSPTVHSQEVGMCSPKAVSNCCQVGRVPSSCILKIGIQACTCSALAVCVPSSRCIITIFHCELLCTNCKQLCNPCEASFSRSSLGSLCRPRVLVSLRL